MNTALPRSLGKPTSPRIAATAPSMLIGIGRPTAPCQAGLDRQGGGHVVAGDAGLPGDREETVESWDRGACAGGARTRGSSDRRRAGPRPARRLPASPRCRSIADRSRTAAISSHRRLHGGAVELAERQQPGRRRGREGGAAGDRRAGGEHGRRSCTVVDARHHHGVDQPGGRRIRQVARCRAGRGPTRTAPCRSARRGRSRGSRCRRRWST